MREVTELNDTWSDDVKQVHREHQQFVSGDLPNVVSWYDDRTAMIVKLLRQFAPNAKTVLDIGCAQGTIAITLSELGYDVTGNDIREYYLTYARLRDDTHRVNFIQSNFLEYRPERLFDAVILIEVIEHVVDHAGFIQHIRECLSPGGVLIVTTPNYDYVRQPLPSFAEVDMANNADKAFTADGSDHFYLFKKSELAGVLEREGLTVVSHEYFLPFIQYGSFKLRTLWKLFPRRLMESVSKPFRGHPTLCAQQVVVAKKQ